MKKVNSHKSLGQKASPHAGAIGGASSSKRRRTILHKASGVTLVELRSPKEIRERLCGPIGKNPPRIEVGRIELQLFLRRDRWLLTPYQFQLGATLVIRAVEQSLSRACDSQRFHAPGHRRATAACDDQAERIAAALLAEAARCLHRKSARPASMASTSVSRNKTLPKRARRRKPGGASS